MNKTKIFFIFSFLFLSIFSNGCTVKPKYSNGVFKSIDSADSWQQKTNVCVLKNEVRALDRVDVNVLVLDPQDNKTIYLGSKKQGLFVSFDAAESWQKIRTLPKGEIMSIAVHPQLKHIVYVAINNQVFKTSDAGRTWQIVYLEAVPKVVINNVAIDPLAPQRIYLGLSDGRLIRSEDDGFSWATINNFNDRIREILINAYDTQRIYVSTFQKGIFRSDNRGLDWISLSKSLKSYAGAHKIAKIIFQSYEPEVLISANDYGLLKTNDSGRTWTEYKLLTGHGKVKIISFAVYVPDPNIIYYVVLGENVVFRSVDGGLNWTPKSVPTKNQLSQLIIDPFNPNILYLGMQSFSN
ncbi:hypothetical protein B6D52_00830 [Candidatus Parcubacteria bacterium 4484_255]|nr:MAG: hypothetical protein B6D52_00830 [Candidatus Parcubacteria bacterium 4484_255]